MICRVASTPSITGMIRSIRIRSGRLSRHLSNGFLAILGNPGDFGVGLRDHDSPQGFDCQFQIVDDRNPYHSDVSDQIGHRPDERVVVKAAFGQIGIRSDLQAQQSVFLTILVRDDDDRQLCEPWVASSGPNQFDAVHPWHIDVRDQQVVRTRR